MRACLLASAFASSHRVASMPHKQQQQGQRRQRTQPSAGAGTAVQAAQPLGWRLLLVHRGPAPWPQAMQCAVSARSQLLGALPPPPPLLRPPCRTRPRSPLQHQCALPLHGPQPYSVRHSDQAIKRADNRGTGAPRRYRRRFFAGSGFRVAIPAFIWPTICSTAVCRPSLMGLPVKGGWRGGRARLGEWELAGESKQPKQLAGGAAPKVVHSAAAPNRSPPSIVFHLPGWKAGGVSMAGTDSESSREVWKRCTGGLRSQGRARAG